MNWVPQHRLQHLPRKLTSTHKMQHGYSANSLGKSRSNFQRRACSNDMHADLIIEACRSFPTSRSTSKASNACCAVSG